PSRRQLRVTLALTLLLILSITGVRVEQGRTLFTTDSGLTARIEALGSGITALTSSSGASQAGPGLLAQAAVRLDGVDFAGSRRPECAAAPASARERPRRRRRDRRWLPAGRGRARRSHSWPRPRSRVRRRVRSPPPPP